MKERLLSWGTLLCLVVLTCLLLLHALAIFPGAQGIRWFFVTSAAVIGRLDAPAWVQAVGSIVAIGAAIGIALWQRRVDHRAAQLRERSAAQITAVSLHHMAAPMIGTLNGCRKSNTGIYEYEAVARVRATHRALSNLALPTDEQLMTLNFVLPKVAADFAVGCSELRHSVVMISLVAQSEDLDEQWAYERLQALDKHLKIALVRLTRARKALNAFIAS